MLPDHMQEKQLSWVWPPEVLVAWLGGLERNATPAVVKINGRRYVEGTILHLYVKTRH